MSLILPLLTLFVFGYGLIRKRPVFTDFCDGVADGLRVCRSVFPTLLLMLICLGVFRASGAMDFLVAFLAPLLQGVGIPSEVLPLVLMRPLSGGGSVSICDGIFRAFGVDSFPGRVAAVLSASTETTFYVLGVYLPPGSQKGMVKFLVCALVTDLVTVFSAVFACRIFFPSGI